VDGVEAAVPDRLVAEGVPAVLVEPVLEPGTAAFEGFF